MQEPRFSADAAMVLKSSAMCVFLENLEFVRCVYF